MDEHKHIKRYTVYMDDASKLSGYSERVFVCVGSSRVGDELVLSEENGTIHAINFARVRWYSAESVSEE